MENMGKQSQTKVILYKNRLEVKLEADTVWLTAHQMAELFGVDRTGIVRHIHNIYQTNELRKKSTCAKNAQVASDGKIRQIDFYSLDMIISVGYRVNSKRGTEFRIWATNLLRKYLAQGYAINERQLRKAEIKYQELQKAVALIGNVLEIDDLSTEARGIAEVIAGYARALDILDDFDHKRLAVPAGTRAAKYKITYEGAREIIETIKNKNASSGLVGQARDQGFKSSLGAIYQTFGGKDVYPTIEEKAAHLLYFVTKNHSFVDGNKRIAAALFVCFLGKNGLLFDKGGKPRIDTNALVALTLLIAASKSAEKDIMIKVILNLLAI
jgi:prophage maintenance system killer protein